MKTETTIYIPTKLTPEVLEWLEYRTVYYCVHNNGEKENLVGEYLKRYYKNESIAHILLPLTVTPDMVEGILHDNIESYEGHWGIPDAANKIMGLLNINKEGENENN